MATTPELRHGVRRQLHIAGAAEPALALRFLHADFLLRRGRVPLSPLLRARLEGQGRQFRRLEVLRQLGDVSDEDAEGGDARRRQGDGGLGDVPDVKLRGHERVSVVEFRKRDALHDGNDAGTAMELCQQVGVGDRQTSSDSHDAHAHRDQDANLLPLAHPELPQKRPRQDGEREVHGCRVGWGKSWSAIKTRQWSSKGGGRTACGNPDVHADAGGPASSLQTRVPALRQRPTLDPGHEGAHTHDDVHGYQDEPHKRFHPAGGEPQQRHSEGALGPHDGRDGDGCPAAEEEGEADGVFDREVPAVTAQPELADENHRQGIVDDDGDLARRPRQLRGPAAETEGEEKLTQAAIKM